MEPQIKTGIGMMACPTSMGWVGVAWSARGLVAVTLPLPTRAEVPGHLPASTGPAPAPPAGLDPAVLADKLRRYFSGQEVVFDEPLDLTIGTDFQQRVWAVARAIPRGQTVTYAEVARKVGSPGAARAVGQAMAHNPWPVVVPCHRVVGYDGRLTGFGGGLDMKRQMLGMEGALEALDRGASAP